MSTMLLVLSQEGTGNREDGNVFYAQFVLVYSLASETLTRHYIVSALSEGGVELDGSNITYPIVEGESPLTGDEVVSLLLSGSPQDGSPIYSADLISPTHIVSEMK